MIFSDKLKRLWHAKDGRFNKEEVQAYFALRMPKFTLRQNVLADLYAKCLSHEANQEFAKIFEAGYKASISSTGKGFELAISGHMDKIHVKWTKGWS